MLRIKLVRSTIGQTKRNRATVAALGLRKMHHSVYHQDTPTIRGMVHHVKHMLLVEEVSEADVPQKAAPKAAAAAKPKPVKETAPKAAKPKAEKPKAATAKADTVKKPKAAPKKSTKKSEEEGK
jgi:large subunit ribosomal protein L30